MIKYSVDAFSEDLVTKCKLTFEADYAWVDGKILNILHEPITTSINNENGFGHLRVLKG
jgi:hypothetical protein